MSLVIGQERANVGINRVDPEDTPVHNWYRFVLSYPPHLVRNYLKRFEVEAGAIVLDPFCGTGTTIVECKKLGIEAIGIDANPFAHFAGNTKLDWTVDPSCLIADAEKIAAQTFDELEMQGIQDEFYQPFDESLELCRLDAEHEKLILKNSISPLPLHKVLILLKHIEQFHNKPTWNHLRLAFAKAVVFSVSNLKFGPEVGVGKQKEDIPVIAAWRAEVKTMAEDITKVRSRASVSAVVHCADARSLADVVRPASIDCVITSPPYPNEKDYSRTTRLESVLLGFINNKEDLRAVKRDLIRSNTRGVYKTDNDNIWVEDYPEIQRIAEEIERRRIEMGKTSGFERLYARVTTLYFGGMAKHFAELRSVLKPGAHLAYVVGDQASYLRVMIRTGQLLARIAEQLGYEVLDIDLFRTRLATATGEQLREEVLVLRWPGIKEGI